MVSIRSSIYVLIGLIVLETLTSLKHCFNGYKFLVGCWWKNSVYLVTIISGTSSH